MKNFLSDRSMTMLRTRAEKKILNDKKKTLDFIKTVMDKYNSDGSPRIKIWAQR